MEPALDTGISKGTLYSGIGHVGLILWVVVGDFLFSHLSLIHISEPTRPY